MDREGRVKEFLDASKYPDFVLAWRCYAEENLELQSAALEYEEAKAHGTGPEIDQARANLVKEWADVQYVLSQLAVYYEIDGQVAFTRVANNNMTKVQNGKVVYRDDGKILKPEGYEPCDMKGL